MCVGTTVYDTRVRLELWGRFRNDYRKTRNVDADLYNIKMSIGTRTVQSQYMYNVENNIVQRLRRDANFHGIR